MDIVQQLASAFHRSTAWAQNCLEKQAELGIQTISMQDSAYPIGFRDLPDPPPFIFVRGSIQALSLPGVAVIGTRQTNPFIEKVGSHAGSYIARKGFSVVSGLALGCDSSAHRGCLSAGGITVAIVATGLEQTYPKRNSSLASQILTSGGALVSEYPFGTALSVPQLIARDRLQSALARGVFVVATGTTGGSWHAIGHAKSLHRPTCFFDYSQTQQGMLPHTDGMVRLRGLGASPVYSQDSIDTFLQTCCAVHA